MRINLPYMPIVFGIVNFKIIILYVKYGMNCFNLVNIVLYKNNLLFQVFMYLHQFALYANNIWNWEFENYYFIC